MIAGRNHHSQPLFPGEDSVPQPPGSPAKNRLLTALPAANRKHLLARCDQVELLVSQVLHAAGEPIEHVYFPTAGFVSLVTPIDSHLGLEIGLVGDEGMVGTSMILGVEISQLRALVQGAGVAWRMDAATFSRELTGNAALLRGLKRYLYVTVTQLAQTAACTRFHVVEARLARWLLMTRDRAHSNEFYITHEFLAYMLGVRRSGITQAAKSLQDLQLIRYRRGNIAIIDEPGLEAAACSCYATDTQTYASVLN
jgi:CRP-like cAMP-binding protein